LGCVWFIWKTYWDIFIYRRVPWQFKKCSHSFSRIFCQKAFQASRFVIKLKNVTLRAEASDRAGSRAAASMAAGSKAQRLTLRCAQFLDTLAPTLL
jgi:hypothetical protein